MQKIVFFFVISFSHLAFAVSVFSVNRQTEAGAFRGSRVFTLECQQENPLKNCKVREENRGTIEKESAVDPKKAQKFLQMAEKQLTAFHGTKVSSQSPHLKWSLNFSGKSITGGTDAEPKDKNKILTALFKLEALLLGMLSQ